MVKEGTFHCRSARRGWLLMLLQLPPLREHGERYYADGRAFCYSDVVSYVCPYSRFYRSGKETLLHYAGRVMSAS